MSMQSDLTILADDNVRFSVIDRESEFNAAIELGAQLGYQRGRYSWQTTPRVLLVRYERETALNRSERYLATTVSRAGERGSQSVRFDASEDTTLTSELGLTGLANVNKRHRSLNSSVSGSWQITERAVGTGQLSVAESRYFDAENTGLVNYDYGSASVAGKYSIREGSRMALSVTTSRLQVPNSPIYDKTTLSASMGLQQQFGPMWRAELSVGPSQVRRTSGPVESGVIYDLNLSRNSETVGFSLDLNRDLTPTGRGLLSRRESINLSLRRQIDERWDVSLQVYGARSHNLLPHGGLEQDALTYASGTVGVAWKMSPTWQLSCSAGYSGQKTESEQPSATRRQARINFSWNGLRHQ
jgi:hypothetical protein